MQRARWPEQEGNLPSCHTHGSLAKQTRRANRTSITLALRPEISVCDPSTVSFVVEDEQTAIDDARATTAAAVDLAGGGTYRHPPACIYLVTS